MSAPAAPAEAMAWRLVEMLPHGAQRVWAEAETPAAAIAAKAQLLAERPDLTGLLFVLGAPQVRPAPFVGPGAY